jgi:prepilin-type N-terminal cleavage/methylation domain-containing protein
VSSGHVCRIRRAAFTLIEVLVVIAVIAILLAILMPTLNRAREHARRVVCMSNQRQLVTAWNMYANHFHDFMPLAYPDGGTSSQPPNNTIDVKFIPWVVGDKRETGAKGFVVWGPDSGEDWLIRAGSICRYLRDTRVYRCSEHDPRYGVNEINISYGINNYLNGAGALKILKRSQVRKPAATYVFNDQMTCSNGPRRKTSAGTFRLGMVPRPAGSAPEWLLPVVR